MYKEHKIESYEKLHEKSLEFFDKFALQLRLVEKTTNSNNANNVLRDGIFEMNIITVSVALRSGANPNIYLELLQRELPNVPGAISYEPVHIAVYTIAKARELIISDEKSAEILSLLVKSGADFSLPAFDKYAGKYSSHLEEIYSVYDWIRDHDFNASLIKTERELVYALLDFDHEKVESYNCVRYHCSIRYNPKGMSLYEAYNNLHPEVYTAILLAGQFPNYHFLSEKCRQFSKVEKDTELLIEEFILIDTRHGAVPDFYQRALLPESMQRKIKMSVIQEHKRGLWWLLKESGNILNSYILSLCKGLNLFNTLLKYNHEKSGKSRELLNPKKVFDALDRLASEDPMLIKQNYREYRKEQFFLNFEPGESSARKEVVFINYLELPFDAFLYSEIDCVYYKSKEGYWCIPSDQYLNAIWKRSNPYSGELLTEELLEEIREKQRIISQIPTEIISFSKCIDELRSGKILDQIDRHTKNVISWFTKTRPNIKELAEKYEVTISHWSDNHLRSIVSQIKAEETASSVWSLFLV